MPPAEGPHDFSPTQARLFPDSLMTSTTVLSDSTSTGQRRLQGSFPGVLRRLCPVGSFNEAFISRER